MAELTLTYASTSHSISLVLPTTLSPHAMSQPHLSFFSLLLSGASQDVDRPCVTAGEKVKFKTKEGRQCCSLWRAVADWVTFLGKIKDPGEPNIAQQASHNGGRSYYASLLPACQPVLLIARCQNVLSHDYLSTRLAIGYLLASMHVVDVVRVRIGSWGRGRGSAADVVQGSASERKEEKNRKGNFQQRRIPQAVIVIC